MQALGKADILAAFEVKGLGKAGILAAFEVRLANTAETGFDTAPAEVQKIALLRLREPMGDA